MTPQDMELTFRCRVQEQALEQEIEQLQTTLERMAEYRVSEYPLSSPLLACKTVIYLEQLRSIAKLAARQSATFVEHVRQRNPNCLGADFACDLSVSVSGRRWTSAVSTTVTKLRRRRATWSS